MLIYYNISSIVQIIFKDLQKTFLICVQKNSNYLNKKIGKNVKYKKINKYINKLELKKI